MVFLLKVSYKEVSKGNHFFNLHFLEIYSKVQIMEYRMSRNSKQLFMTDINKNLNS